MEAQASCLHKSSRLKAGRRAVAPDKADEMLRELHAAGVAAAAFVGTLVEATEKTVVLTGS